MSSDDENGKVGITRAAMILGISRPTMRKLAGGSLPPDEVSGGGRFYWRITTLQAFKQQPRSALPTAARLICPSIPSVCSRRIEPPRWCKAVDFPISQESAPGSFKAALEVVFDALVEVILLPAWDGHCPYRSALIKASMDAGTQVLLLPDPEKL